MDRTTGALHTARRITPAWAKVATIRLLRGYGRATSRLRGLPSFVIIGGKRCGTTTLYWHLVQHPSVLPLLPRAKRIKGVHFFDWNFERGTGWYRSHFPLNVHRSGMRWRHGCEPVSGEASSSYLFHPRAPLRASLVAPEAKVIVLLRNPVERAWSHYGARVRKGAEPLSFEAAIESEPDRVRGELERVRRDPAYRSQALEQQAYLGLGLYLDPLSEWMRRFPRDRVLILRTEDLATDASGTYREVLRFLELPAWTPSVFRDFNAAPARVEMRPETRSELAARFAPHNRRLSEYLGMELGWDEA
jgi:hypothetical protein